MRFLDIKTDYAFKKVFGSEDSKERLLSFLNAVIKFPNGAKVKDLEILDPYNIPMLQGMKNTCVDVKARLDDDTLVIIEMQVVNQRNFQKRILYNAAKNYSIQLKDGKDYKLLNPVIALSVLDFVMFEETDKVVTYFKMIEKNEFIEYQDSDIELIFIELPKFKKSLEECKDILDKWIYFIKNAGSMEYIPKNMEPQIVDAFEVVNQCNMSPEEYELQEKRMDFIRVQRDIEDTGFYKGYDKGLEKGIEKGIEKGEKKAKLEMAKKLLRAGVDKKIVIETTGLTLKDIEALV
jgi:predicted transposase/invertase (TIGR01784 family)